MFDSHSRHFSLGSKQASYSYEASPMYYVYILQCSNNTFYTGITNNLKRRLYEHKNGLSTFTKYRLPVNLVYYEQTPDRKLARAREKVIKDMNQSKKRILIGEFTSSVNEKRE